MFVSVEDEKIKQIQQIIPKLKEISDVEIIYDDKTKAFNVNSISNPYEAMKIVSVIKAIDYGFSVDDALKLMSDDYMMDVIDLKQVIGNNPDSLRRIKGRIIGENGKAKKIIQEYTGVLISIKDHIVAIIGIYDQLAIAKKAIELLIEGKEHSTVYKFLDKAEAQLISMASKNRSYNFK
ncbi:RNA-processing protein [Acidianus sulfidivorans JP7]|uniref:RNA-processing protein n=1 Tax=Acidianus sulfidivorans JP7 TaxID=619593 RepID=A0A2U9IKZ8_9CREN|nr:RNA-processing protein [Acidianus sulfidivorans]AWR96665.1 RNA-processing protein [Acidianus sulfidivorans JP7]